MLFRSAIQAACTSVVVDYRVYKVIHPQVHLLANGLAWSNRLDAAEVGALPLASKSVSPWFVRAMAKLNSRLARANALVDPVVVGARAMTVSAYNADPKAGDRQAKAWRKALEKARGPIRSAERDVRRLTNWTPPTPTSSTVA